MSSEEKEDVSRRPAPFLRHVSAGPPGAATDFLKEQLNKQARSNFNSSSLDTPAIIGEKSQKNEGNPEKSVQQESTKKKEDDKEDMSKQNSVNRTSLHPGGVQSVYYLHLTVLMSLMACETGLSQSTRSSRRSSMRRLTLTTIAWQL